VKRATGFGQPGPGQSYAAKSDNQHLNIPPGEFSLLLAQLCHVFTARQSTQVTQKHQQHMLAAA
jgi:hypothetical protein